MWPGGLGGCASGVGLLGASALAITRDGRSLYVAGRDADAVAAFSLDPSGGALLQLGGKQACIRGGDDSGACADGRALAGADALAIAPDGLTVYAAAKNADAVAILQRDATTGALSQQPGLNGCTRLAGGLGCTTARSLAQPSALAIGSNGRDVYVASTAGNAISILQRDATGALAQPAGVAGCIAQGVVDCTSAPLMTAPDALALGADGTSLAVGTSGDGTIVTLVATSRRACSPRSPRPRAASRRPPPPAARRCRSSGRRHRSRSPRPATALRGCERWPSPSRARRPRRASRASCAPASASPTQLLLPCTDPNGDALTYAIDTKAAHGSLSLIKGAAVTYKPKPGYKGLDAFTVKVGDGSGALTPRRSPCASRVTAPAPWAARERAAQGRAGMARATLDLRRAHARRLHGHRDDPPRRTPRPRDRAHDGEGRRRALRIITVPLKAQGRIALSGGAWRKATLIVVARDKHGNGGTLGRSVILHGSAAK